MEAALFALNPATGLFAPASYTNPIPVANGETSPSLGNLLISQSVNTNGQPLNTTGYNTVLVLITAAVALSGGTTLNFEASADGGTTWDGVRAKQVGTLFWAVSTTSTGTYEIDVTGYSLFRCRISNYSAGTCTATGWLSAPSPSAMSSEVTLGTALSDQIDSIIATPKAWNYTNITTTATTVASSTPVKLHSITINTPVASSVITIYDNTSAAAPKMGTITLPSTLLQMGPYQAILDWSCLTGLTIVTATAASDITVAWG